MTALSKIGLLAGETPAQRPEFEIRKGVGISSPRLTPPAPNA